MSEAYKVVVLGAKGVGKSAVVGAYTRREFNLCGKGSGHVEFALAEEGDVAVQLWDTAGQDTHGGLSTLYFRGAKGVVVVYDVTREDSLQAACDWIETALSYAPHATYMLLGNKTDLVSLRAVSLEEAMKAAERYTPTPLVYETSALEGSNITHAFGELIASIRSQEVLRLNAPVSPLLKEGSPIALSSLRTFPLQKERKPSRC